MPAHQLEICHSTADLEVLAQISGEFVRFAECIGSPCLAVLFVLDKIFATAGKRCTKPAPSPHEALPLPPEPNLPALPPHPTAQDLAAFKAQLKVLVTQLGSTAVQYVLIL